MKTVRMNIQVDGPTDDKEEELLWAFQKFVTRVLIEEQELKVLGHSIMFESYPGHEEPAS